jgi:hypothetical protein
MRLLFVIFLLAGCGAEPLHAIGDAGFEDGSYIHPLTEKECCRICIVGKPCGDTCIDEMYDCHQSAGCACSS